MRLAIPAVALLLLSGIAGCMGGDTDPDPVTPTDPTGPVMYPDWAVNAIFAGHDPADSDDQTIHDLSDRSLHQGLSTPNFIDLGWDPLVTGFHGVPAGGYFCGGVSDLNERQLAVVGSFTSGVAFVVVDVTDPSAPVMLGELALPRTQIYDADISADGKYVVLASSPLAPIVHEDGTGTLEAAALAGLGLEDLVGTVPTYTETPVWTDRCGNTYQGPEQELPFHSGTILVDIRDPEEPAVADFVPAPALGPHSVSTQTVDGRSLVASSITNLAHAASYFQFFEILEIPVLELPKLLPVSFYTSNYLGLDSTPDNLAEATLTNGHVDATIHQHPITGDLLAYLANWDGGMITVDISTPVATAVSQWGQLGTPAGARAGASHSTLPLPYLIDDRYYVLMGQEVGGSFNQDGNRRPTGQIVLLDMTDPAEPEPVARWTLPVYVRWSGDLHFSTHYMAVVDDVLFVALYHGGVWAADLRPEVWPELPSLGVYIPANDPPAEAASGGGFAPYAPYVLDVLPLADGSLVIFDAGSGAYTVQFDRSVPVVPAAPWTEDAWIGS